MYIFFADPGHAWLRVLKTEIEPIKDKISSYSYMNRKYVYLEEDCDAGIFIKYKFGKDISYRELENKGIIKEKYSENTIIRSFESYNPFDL